jgi:protoporphyrinogen oxidase
MYDILIIGAGPAGLTAAWEAEKLGKKTLILESDKVVGGISRTVEKNGWKFDIGGHRFFTKVEEVNNIWDEILEKEEFLLRPRMSRIYYKNKFYDYPLKASNALFNLGVLEAIRCVLSYFYVRVFPPKNQDNFENWVAARFGWRLYNIFFKTYTEKVWGIDAKLIGSDWASQRIKNLSLMKAILNAFKLNQTGEVITTLIDEFKYPKYGPGMMWETAHKKLEDKGHVIMLSTKVTEIIKFEQKYKIKTNTGKEFVAKHILSSMPLAHLPNTIKPSPDNNVMDAGKNLKFRDFLSVALVVDNDNAFPDNWIYIHDPQVKVGRVQNYGSWSPYLVKEGKTCLGLEYFVNVNDEMWNMQDQELINLAIYELEKLNLVSAGSKFEGYVVRMPKAYPVYDLNYSKNIELIKSWIMNFHPNIHPIGRNGMHRYNNQDHSMMTAVLSIRNIIRNEQNDIWNVNVEGDYHEEFSERQVPKLI